MPSSDAATSARSNRTLTFAAYASFVPIGLATVVLGPLLPELSARWSLSYSQAGVLFTLQYFAATLAVAVSGVLVSMFGFRFAIKTGLLLMSAGLALLLAGPKALGMICIAAYGGGIGLAVPAANLLVAEVNPEGRNAALNRLNFYWGTGAVASPFLVSVASKYHELRSLIEAMAVCGVIVAVGIAIIPLTAAERNLNQAGARQIDAGVVWKRPVFPILVALFFIYVGTENGIGQWVATYAKGLGSLNATMALMTPAFFYLALTVGRWLAPLPLRVMDEVHMAQTGLLLACLGATALLFSRGLVGVVTSACLAGLGMSIVYPTTITLLSREFGASASRVGSVMFFCANIGGGVMPWLVGVCSTRFGSLKAGLLVPLAGGVTMSLLYLWRWKLAVK